MSQATFTGTHDIATLAAARFQSVAEFGVDNVAEIINRDLAAHNALVTDMMAQVADVTTDRQRISGTSINGFMVEVDE